MLDKYLFVILCFSSLFIIQNDKEVNYGEYFYLIIFSISFLRVYYKIIILGKITKNKIDSAFFLFIIYVIVTLGITVSIGNPFVKGLREAFPLILIGNYFIYKNLIERKDRNLLIYIPIIVSFIIAIKNIYNYKTTIAIAEYYYEITGVRKVSNEPLFMASILFVIPLYLKSTRKYFKLLFIGVVGILITALILTFSRGYWVGLIIGLFIVLILETKKNRISLVFTILIIQLLIISTLYIMFPNMFQLFLSAVFERLGSVSNALSKDVSFLNRIQEWKFLIVKIFDSPFVGYGFGSTFRFHDVIVHYMKNSDYSHNFYLYITFKIGIIGALIFLSFIFSQLYQNVRAIFSTQINLERSQFIIGTTIILVFMIISISSPQFIQKDSNYILACSIAYMHLSLETSA